MTLGGLISQLEACGPDQSVRFDFCTAVPDLTVDSFRGYYDQLALGWTVNRAEPPKVSELLVVLRQAVGATFTGWKGGDYVMRLGTRLWVDNPGECYNTEPFAVEDDYGVIIATRHVVI